MLADFNAVRKIYERKGVNIGNTNKREITRFNKFIDNTGMHEIPYVGRKYTWYRPNGNVKRGIYRVFVSFELLNQWP